MIFQLQHRYFLREEVKIQKLLQLRSVIWAKKQKSKSRERSNNIRHSERIINEKWSEIVSQSL